MPPLNAKRRSELRAEAHKLSPIVIIGDKGLTDEVIAEIDRSLKAHELIKVRAATDERDARDLWLETICERVGAHAVQQIGKIFVLYRENPKEEARKPKPQPEPRGEGGRRSRPRASVMAPAPLARRRTRSVDSESAPFGKRRARGVDPESAPVGKRRPRGPKPDEGTATRTARPRSRTPSPRPASGPPRRRPKTSR